MVPAPFRSLRVLRVLNVGAVGLALAALVSAVFVALLKELPVGALTTGLPTWGIGTLWALMLRWPKTVRGTSFRWGWAASVPLAALNSAIALALAMSNNSGGDFRLGAVLGATFGVIAWLPALILTLLCFGIPIASAQHLAAKGLAGEERGEKIVGLACLAMSVLGAIVWWLFPAKPGSEGAWMTLVFAALGALTGGASALLAGAREARRRRFVADAEAGKIRGYRVEPTEDGKVLVRVVWQGEGYRVRDFEEEVFELGAEGEATRPKVLTSVRPV